MSAFEPPKFRYPPEWEDRERMHYLLAPIPPNKSLSSHDPKITFWASLIKSSSQELQRPIFTERELQARFKWNQFTSPSCLSSVISSMESAGEVIKMAEIRQSVQQNVGWVSWGVGIIKKPVSWALRNYLSSPASANVDEEYVVVLAIKELANRVVAEHQKRVEFQSTDRVLKHSSFVDLCKTAIGVDNVSTVEMWLLKENRIAKATATTPQGDQEIVKFCTKGDAITETDIGILSIKESIDSLSNQVHRLQEKSVQLKQRAVEQFKAKNKNGALKLLRQHKVAQGSLDKREGALDNLQNILHQIQMAETDAMVYEAYKRGAEALKSLRESSGFTVDDIDEVAVSLQDALEANQEISEALNAPVSQDTHDEDSLEAELMAFLKTDQSEVPAAAVSSPTKQTTDEDELEARLASLSIGAGQREKGTVNLDQHEPGGRDKSQTSTKRLTVQPLPA